MARSRSRSPSRRSGFKWKGDHDYRKRDTDGKSEGHRGSRRHQRGERDRDRYRESEKETKQTKEKTSSSKLSDSRQEEYDRPTSSVPEKKTPAPAAAGESMIVVHVNDRLGTKAAIPCLASDPIKLFKAQVAARIGREPHEILLKRQGERPFKDQLTLEDYGVSNGVQIDL